MLSARTLCPPFPRWPPLEALSIWLASTAMTQHWLTSEHAHTRTYRRASSCQIPLGVWSSLFPGFFSASNIFLVCCEDLQMYVDSPFLLFHLDWRPKGNTRALKLCCFFFLYSCLGTLLPWTLHWTFVTILLFHYYGSETIILYLL